MKSLEILTSQEIQPLHKAVIQRFETIEELFRTDKQGDEVQTNENIEDLTSPVPLRVRDNSPSALATYPVTISEKPENSK